MKKKLIGISIASLLLLSSSISAFAAGYQTYTDYQLYANYSSNYTNIHAKTTNDKFINNKMTRLYNTTTAVFWACNSGYTKISNAYEISNQEYNVVKQIGFTTLFKPGAGDSIGMGMQDAWSSSGRGLVSGSVDFR